MKMEIPQHIQKQKLVIGTKRQLLKEKMERIILIIGQKCKESILLCEKGVTIVALFFFYKNIYKFKIFCYNKCRKRRERKDLYEKSCKSCGCNTHTHTHTSIFN